MPQFEITVDLPESFQYPVEVQRAFSNFLVYPVTKVVKVQPKFPPDLNGFDHLFTDTQALVDAVRYDSTPGSFEDSVIEPIPNEDHPDWCDLCCEVHIHNDDLEEVDALEPRYQKTVDNQLHDSVVRLEGAVTQLKRALEEALRAVK